MDMSILSMDTICTGFLYNFEFFEANNVSIVRL
jgi:hypothetical protein